MGVNLTLLKKFSYYYLFTSCLLFFLFDNYVSPPGIRPFDWIGIILVLVGAFVGILNVNIPSKLKLNASSIFIILINLFAITAGFLFQESNAYIFLIIGPIITLVLLNSILLRDNLCKIIESLIITLSLFVFIQSAFIIFGNEPLNFLILSTEIGLRNEYGGILLRPTGLYIEPGSHALAMISLLALYSFLYSPKLKYFKLIYAIGILGVFASLSTAGIIISVAMTAANILLLNGNQKLKKLIAFLLFIILIILLFSLYDGVRVVIIDRLELILSGSDTSMNARFGLWTIGCWNFLYESSIFQPILGAGISSDAFALKCGSNNVAFLLYSYGIFSGFIIIFLILKNFWKSPGFLICSIYLILASQLSSYGFFWVFLAMVRLCLNNNIIFKFKKYAR